MISCYFIPIYYPPQISAARFHSSNTSNRNMLARRYTIKSMLIKTVVFTAKTAVTLSAPV